jgi:hypothetical protein
MVNSYLNIITFLLTTVFYYLALKPNLKYNDLTNSSEYKKYSNNNHLYLGIYFLLILIIQFIVNATIITTKCGGSVTENLGASGVLTFVPWTLIFGVVILVILVYPGFKTAFSDVIGYFYVANSANQILTELLVNTKINDEITNEQMTSMSKKQLEKAADMIIKICGNTSILINQIVPSNFIEYWNLLRPLMKDKYKMDGPLVDEKRNELFELVVTRDNVGEAMWFIYSGLLVCSIVQLKISTRSCSTNPKQIAKNYQEYLSKQEAIDKKNKQATSTVYTITN